MTIEYCSTCNVNYEYVIGEATHLWPPEPRHVGHLRIPYPILVELLRLPAGSRILRIGEYSGHFETLDVVVEHPGLPKTKVADLVQWVDVELESAPAPLDKWIIR